MSRELARRGASVVAVDVAHQLLAKAWAAETAEPLGIDPPSVSARASTDEFRLAG